MRRRLCTMGLALCLPWTTWAGEADMPCPQIEKANKLTDSKYGPEFTVCVDATRGLHVAEIPTLRQYVHPLPHQRLRVRVFHDPGTVVSVGSNGTVAATAAGVRGVSTGTQDATTPDVEAPPLEGNEVDEAKEDTAKALEDLAQAADAAQKQTLNSRASMLAQQVRLNPLYQDRKTWSSVIGMASKDRAQADDKVQEAIHELRVAVAELIRVRNQTTRAYTDFVLGPYADGEVELTITRSSPAPTGTDAPLASLRDRVREHEDNLPTEHTTTGATARAEVIAQIKLVRARIAALKATTPDALEGFKSALGDADLQAQLTAITYTAPATPDDGSEPSAEDIATEAKKVITRWQKLADTVEDLGTHLSDADGASSTKVDLVVDQTYTGAVSVGIGGFGFGAASGSYSVEVLDGGQSAYVDASGTSPFDLDLVLGYTQLFHRRPASSTAPHLGMTFGVNIASISAKGVDPLKGIYLGPSIGSKNLTIAPVLSARPVDRLRDRYNAGGAVSPTTKDADLVNNPIGLGFGFVIYAPEIIKNGQNGAS